MTRHIAVLRPEPGNSETAALISAQGLTPIRLPLFVTTSLDWAAPDPKQFDALFLTSANAVRLGGPELDRLAELPAYAVGEATARAARAAGLTVVMVGTSDGAALRVAANERGIERALLLSGRDRSLEARGNIAQTIAIYSSDPLPITSSSLHALRESVALLHSSRAAQRLAVLVREAGFPASSIRLATISTAVARAAGSGWALVETAASPDDKSMVALARTLAD